MIEANIMAGPTLPPGPTNPQPLNFGFNSGPYFDVIELLPAAAADKLRMLRQRSADAHALIPEFESIREASGAKIAAAQALQRLTDHPQDGGFNLPLTDRRVIVATKHLEKMTDDFERLKQLQEVRTAAFQSASAAMTNAETWLRDGRPHGTTLEAIEVDPPKLAKGENSLLDQIENRRRRVRELRADLHRIESAPFPSTYAKQKMRAQIEALAMQGAPSVSRLVELDGPVDFQTQRMQSDVYGTEKRAIAFSEPADAVALVAFLHKPALIAALDAEIDAEADDAGALTHEARQIRTAEVKGDLLDIEIQEAALIWQAQAQGLPVEHRAECDPLAILQIKLVTAAAAGYVETSWMHGIDVLMGRR
jgi:hypothetical protein